MPAKNGSMSGNLLNELVDLVGVESLYDDEEITKELKKIRSLLVQARSRLLELGYFEITKLPITQATRAITKVVE